MVILAPQIGTMERTRSMKVHDALRMIIAVTDHHEGRYSCQRRGIYRVDPFLHNPPPECGRNKATRLEIVLVSM